MNQRNREEVIGKLRKLPGNELPKEKKSITPKEEPQSSYLEFFNQGNTEKELFIPQFNEEVEEPQRLQVQWEKREPRTPQTKPQKKMEDVKESKTSFPKGAVIGMVLALSISISAALFLFHIPYYLFIIPGILILDLILIFLTLKKDKRMKKAESKEKMKKIKPIQTTFEEDGATEILSDEFVPQLILYGPNQTSFLIESEVFTLGKEREIVDGFVNNSTVSRRHLTIINRDDQNYVIDHHSSNGSFVNDIQVIPETLTEIKVGDIIKLSNLEYVVGKPRGDNR